MRVCIMHECLLLTSDIKHTEAAERILSSSRELETEREARRTLLQSEAFDHVLQAILRTVAPADDHARAIDELSIVSDRRVRSER